MGPVQVPVAEIEEADWDAVMNTNLKAVWMCMKFQIPAMLKHGKGAIVNISSVYGFKASDVGHAPYCTSKHGVSFPRRPPSTTRSKGSASTWSARGLRIRRW